MQLSYYTPQRINTTTGRVKPMPKGDCFLAAYTSFMNLYDPSVRLVHARVLARSGPLAWTYHWHAWLEGDGRNGRVALDTSNDRIGSLSVEEYHKLARPRDIHIYDRHQVAKNIAFYGHCGPWDGSIKPITSQKKQGL